MVRRQPAPALPVPGFELSESGGTIFYGTDGIMAVTSHQWHYESILWRGSAGGAGPTRLRTRRRWAGRE
jgi:hypothetical protein